MRQTFIAVLSICAMAVLLTGCGGDMVTFNSKGQVGIEQRDLIILATALMLLVVIPAIAMTFWFGWKYRESNTDAEYLPDWSHSTKIEIFAWGVPCLIIAVLAYVTYVTCHTLDPYKKLTTEQIEKSAARNGKTVSADMKPVTIQVIAEPFKWVFIYPEENIATVNEIYLPVNTPVTFQITSDFSMNSFLIPQLAGQVYAMAGMKTDLNMIADKEGVFNGLSANYAGHGFSRMRFKAHAVSQGDYAAWVKQAKATKATLDQTSLKGLMEYDQQGLEQAKASGNIELDEHFREAAPVQYFSAVEPGLFKSVLNKYMPANHAAFEAKEHASEGAEPAHAEMANMAGMKDMAGGH